MAWLFFGGSPVETPPTTTRGEEVSCWRSSFTSLPPEAEGTTVFGGLMSGRGGGRKGGFLLLSLSLSMRHPGRLSVATAAREESGIGFGFSGQLCGVVVGGGKMTEQEIKARESFFPPLRHVSAHPERMGGATLSLSSLPLGYSISPLETQSAPLPRFRSKQGRRRRRQSLAREPFLQVLLHILVY